MVGDVVCRYEKIYFPIENEVWINCGSYVGDTILHYLTLRKQFKKIYAVEIAKENILSLHKLFNVF